ncbi:MAG: hypothetical protein QOD06_1125 [Candidatus Binatota bacterium]|nr:hypothetical protein [Candidatus Binatota bacterium]
MLVPREEEAARVEGSRPRTVLVTGATGVVGRHLVPALLRQGSRVRCLVRRPDSAAPLASSAAEIVSGSVEDRDAVARALDGCRVVFHLAAADAAEGDAILQRTNVDGTRTVLEAARAAGTERVVHVSTVAVHGAVGSPPADEDAPLEPGDAYQRTKLEGENLAREYSQEGLAVVILRPASLYGPGDVRLLPLFRLALRRPPVLLGSGKTLYHLLYVDDLVRALVLAGEPHGPAAGTFIVAGPEATTIRELYREIAEAAGHRHPRIVRLPVRPLLAAERATSSAGLRFPVARRELEFFVKDRSFRTDRARDALGFVPEISIGHGIRRTLAWYRQRGLVRR